MLRWAVLRALLPTLLLLLPACAQDLEEILDEIDGVPRATDSSGDTTSPTPTVTGDTSDDLPDGIMTSTAGEAGSSGSGSDGDGASAGETSTTSETGSGPLTDTGDSTDTADSPPVGDAEKPIIVSLELPANVYAAGPVPLAVQTIHTASVRVLVDDADAGELVAAGGGLFTGDLKVRGAIDNGTHQIEVIATQGKYEDSKPGMYDVSTPKPGTEAWSMAGPAGSRTNRVAVTPAGNLIEGGQTEIDGVPRPTLRMRSNVNGAQLWPEGTIILDTREGAVVDVAMLPDGRMWVAMNVREPKKDPQPRIVLLDADGHPTGIEVMGTSGRMVRAIAADGDGGCFAVGLAGVMGDWDIARWRITAAGVPTLGDTFDYQPPLDPPHTFLDVANDVLIDEDVVWVIGMSQGKHEKLAIRARGMIVAMDLHTGEVSAPVIIAPLMDTWTKGAFFGGALHPDGVLVTGYRCNETCSTYQIETSLYDAAGERTWNQGDGYYSGLAYGSDVVLDSQGRALVAGAATQGGKLQGYVFAREVNQNNGFPLFEYWFPGVGPSEGLGIACDSFDRIFPVGYITSNGATQARLTLIHG